MGKQRRFKWTDHSTTIVARAIDTVAHDEGRVTPSAVLTQLQSAGLRCLPTIDQLRLHLRQRRQSGDLVDGPAATADDDGVAEEVENTASRRRPRFQWSVEATATLQDCIVDVVERGQLCSPTNLLREWKAQHAAIVPLPSKQQINRWLDNHRHDAEFTVQRRTAVQWQPEDSTAFFAALLALLQNGTSPTIAAVLGIWGDAQVSRRQISGRLARWQASLEAAVAALPGEGVCDVGLSLHAHTHTYTHTGSPRLRWHSLWTVTDSMAQ